MLHLCPSKHQQTVAVPTCSCPMWLPASLDYIFKRVDSKPPLSGTVQYLGHGRTRTTYALPGELVLKVGRNRETSKLAQQTELQLSKDHPEFFPAIHASGEAKLWDEAWQKVQERLVPAGGESAAHDCGAEDKLRTHHHGHHALCREHGPARCAASGRESSKSGCAGKAGGCRRLWRFRADAREGQEEQTEPDSDEAPVQGVKEACKWRDAADLLAGGIVAVLLLLVECAAEAADAGPEPRRSRFELCGGCTRETTRRCEFLPEACCCR